MSASMNVRFSTELRAKAADVHGIRQSSRTE